MTIKLTRYLVELPTYIWERAHFELRLAEDERPFHISLRSAENTVILNRMRAGDWGTEQVQSPPVPVSEIDKFYIEVLGPLVTIFIAGVTWSFEMDLNGQTAPHLVDDVSVQWTKLVDSEAMAVRRLENGGVTDTIHLAGRDLALGDAVNMPAAADLIIASFDPSSEHQHFLVSRPLVLAKQPLTVIDVDPVSIIQTLRAAILFPDAAILKLHGTAEADALLAAIIRANDISNIRFIASREIAAPLSKGKGHVLLQGEGVFKQLGMAIAALPTARRAKLSIFTGNSAPVPGNIVFPCANAHIRIGKNWCLNYNAATSIGDRVHGLDIAIAAYNAKDYLIECAESLLSKGRDDIRVIIVDDGSTDGCGDMAAQHFKKTDQVRVERKPNGGCAPPRNYGRLLSNATHIAFVDADDFVTPDFFANLYDLALYSGYEITQGAFDFHDATREEPLSPSYEQALFAPYPRMHFNDQPVIRLPAMDIIKGQPTIWRRVYRRDFLDAKNIFFPENVRAYDDYIFHMLTLTAAQDILMMPEQAYHYRQHPDQDIKQGDERHFYMLIMFQMLLKRSIIDAWPNFSPYAESIVDSINWSAQLLRPDLVDSFLRACARFCVTITKVYSNELMEGLIDRINHPDFKFFYREEARKLASIDPGAFWCHLTGELYHPDIVRMRQTMRRAI